MPSWLWKAGLQGVISFLPRYRDINYLFQKNVTSGLRLKESYFDGKLNYTQQHLKHYQAEHHKLPDNALELGTGWLPIVPIGLYLSGVNEIFSVDINPHIRPELVRDTIDFYLRYANTGRFAASPDRIANLEKARVALETNTVAEALKHMNIKLLVTDARDLKLPGKSVQLFVSNNTLEHIPYDVIQGIFQEFWRVATPNAIMSHLIDLSDHYSHFDKSITPYHFLRFSPSQWRMFNNKIHYQNRLRIVDYRDLHIKSGFKIINEKNEAGSASQIQQIKLADTFRSYKHEDIIVTTSWLVSTPTN